MKINKTKSTRQQRFEAVAVRRTNEAIKKIRALGKCSNRNNYNYDERDVLKIFDTLDKELKRVKQKFLEKPLKEFKLN